MWVLKVGTGVHSFIGGGLIQGDNGVAPQCRDPTEDLALGWPGFYSLSELTELCSLTMYLFCSHIALGTNTLPLSLKMTM